MKPQITQVDYAKPAQFKFRCKSCQDIWLGHDGMCAPCSAGRAHGEFRVLVPDLSKLVPCTTPGCPMRLPYSGKCGQCYQRETEALERKDNLGRTLASIPESFRVGWSEHDVARRKISPVTFRQAGKAISEIFVVITGARSGVGKSSLLGAMLSEWSRRTGQWGAWLRAFDVCSGLQLDPDWMRAPVLAIDDLGAERQMKSSLACDLIDLRKHALRPMWVTTALDENGIGDLYGAQTARRVFEDAEVIRL